MIFVTVGNHYQGFERLVKKMDEIAGRIDEKVIMQIGTTEYKPVNAEYFDFIDSFEEIERLNREARVVVSHAGVGSILTALEQVTPVIIVPRLKKFDEHMDDHQLEIAEAMSENHNVKAVYDVEELENCLTKNLNFVDESKENILVNSVKNYLSSIT
ncbi:MAG: PssE/Cps14G family polysaccharide biosynthesis glycosyltransferase [Candidatus Methanoperedens sp.]